MPEPRISVAICTYNGGVFIKEQLASIMRQTLSVSEIIICDDGSTDETLHIINQFSKQLEFEIKVYVNSINVGAKSNFEKALSYCSGDIILLSDQDDIWHPSKVEQVIKYFGQNPEILGVFSNGAVIDSDGRTLDQRLWGSIHFDTEAMNYIDKNGLFDYLVNMASAVTGAALAIRKEALRHVLPFRLMNLLWHDEWIALRLARDGKLGWLDKDLISYRVHANQQVGISSLEKMQALQSQFHLELKGNVPEDQLRNTVWKRWYTYKKAMAIGKVITGIEPVIVKAKNRFEEAFSAFLKQYPLHQRLLKKVKFYVLDARKYSFSS